MFSPNAATESRLDWASPVVEVMTRDVYSVPAAEPIATVRRLLDDAVYHHLPVVEDNKPVGMISAANLALAAVLECAPHGHAGTARDIMTRDPALVPAQCSVAAAARTMLERRVDVLPVVDEAGVLLGIVTRTDLLRVMASQRA